MAMRASMSVPGLLAPIAYRDRKLVDGGLVDNVPIREVRSRCDPDVVIAVNVGSPLLKAEEVSSLLSVSAQMVNILTEQNVTQSLAQLSPGDIYIKPDLEGISAADFERHAETADRGRAAAEAMVPRLQQLGVSELQYEQWWRGIGAKQARAPRIDEIEIAAMPHVAPAAVERHIEQKEGEPLDTARLDQDLLRVFGDGWFQSVDYTLLRARDRNILRITPVEKPWGPNYLRLGVNLEVADQGSTFDLRVGYQKTWLNRLGGELLLLGQIGNTTGLGVEFYQPLDPAQQFFVEPIVGYDRRLAPLYQVNQKFAEYRVERATGQMAAGVNVGLLGQARLGWLQQRLDYSLETGLPTFPTASVTYGGPFFSVDFDQFDRLYFPSRGWATKFRYFSSSDPDFSRADVELKGAYPVGRYVLSSELSYTGSPRGTLPIFDAARLGGFLRMSAFAKDQLVGDDTYYAQLRAERILGYLPIGLRGDIRLGVALETAHRGIRYSETQLTGWLNSASVYLGGETPLGPLYLGYGYSTSGTWNVYFFLGTP
jgi:NTE family protein